MPSSKLQRAVSCAEQGIFNAAYKEFCIKNVDENEPNTLVIVSRILPSLRGPGHNAIIIVIQIIKCMQ